MKLMEISQQNEKTKAPVVEESLVEKKETGKEKKIIVDEDTEKVDVGFATFLHYFKHYNGGNLFFFILNLTMIISFSILLLQQYTVGCWT